MIMTDAQREARVKVDAIDLQIQAMVGHGRDLPYDEALRLAEMWRREVGAFYEAGEVRGYITRRVSDELSEV